MTTENNKTILDTIRAIRRLPQDTALILRTADGFMNELEWEGIRRDNQSTWRPQVLFSIYCNKMYPHIYIFFSIIVGDENDVVESNAPLISAGVINYGIGNLAYDFGWDYVKVACRNNGGKDDYGTPMKITIPTDTPEQFKAESVSYVYYPLVRITGAEILSALILKPLKLMISDLEK